VTDRIDPVACLSPAEIVVVFAGRRLVVPAMRADGWLAVLMDPDAQVDDIFPGLLPIAGQELVWEAVDDGETTPEAVAGLALEVLTQAAGRPYWEVQRLVGIAVQHWEVLGTELLLSGVRAETVTLGEWLNALFVVLLRQVAQSDPKSGHQRAVMVQQQIQRPPFEVMAEEFDEEAEAALFLAQMQAQAPS
jgi:hypothetical protein